MRKIKTSLVFFVIITQSSNAQFSANDLITEYKKNGLDNYGFKTGVTGVNGINIINTYYGDLSSNILMGNGPAPQASSPLPQASSPVVKRYG